MGSPVPVPFQFEKLKAASSWNAVLADRKAMMKRSLVDPPPKGLGFFGIGRTVYNWDGSWYGNGRSSTDSTTVKTAVFAPMPIASAPIATAVKPGLRLRLRKA